MLFDVVQRAKEAETWTQIIEDLKAAESILGDVTNKFFASKQAVQAL